MNFSEFPGTYVSSPESHIRINNYPNEKSGVTPIQIATFNRPEKLNAMTSQMINDLISFLSAADKDDRIKVVIITGEGKVFCAGIDLNMDTRKINTTPIREMRDPGGVLAMTMFNCSKPVIVAYNGLSVGIGMTSTLASTLRVAPKNSEFGFPFSRIGLTMESCSSFFLPRMVGYSNATYLLGTGRRFRADSPVLQGIFAELVDEPSQVLPKALEIAQDIMDNVSTVALYLNRQMMWRDPGSIEKAHLIDSPVLYDRFASKDHQEFKASFFGKRKPHFEETLAANPARTYPWWTEISTAVKGNIIGMAKPKI
ncbi:ClpP/crotonase [Pyrenochaeta sp. DS3sAY3a]|nr:ClpP/crotonase [Pyrenochaeta sp. DS3sAY3a]